MSNVMSTKKSEAQRAEEKLAKTKADIAKRYPHALVDTLTFDAAKNKFKVRIKCVVSGNTDRWVYTSDLFQVTMCVEEAAKAKAKAKADKKVKLAAAMAIVKSQAEPTKTDLTQPETPATDAASDETEPTDEVQS